MIYKVSDMSSTNTWAWDEFLVVCYGSQFLFLNGVGKQDKDKTEMNQ